MFAPENPAHKKSPGNKSEAVEGGEKKSVQIGMAGL
jgi:hypothetical protein